MGMGWNVTWHSIHSLNEEWHSRVQPCRHAGLTVWQLIATFLLDRYRLRMDFGANPPPIGMKRAKGNGIPPVLLVTFLMSGACDSVGPAVESLAAILLDHHYSSMLKE